MRADLFSGARLLITSSSLAGEKHEARCFVFKCCTPQCGRHIDVGWVWVLRLKLELACLAVIDGVPTPPGLRADDLMGCMVSSGVMRRIACRVGVTAKCISTLILCRALSSYNEHATFNILALNVNNSRHPEIHSRNTTNSPLIHGRSRECW